MLRPAPRAGPGGLRTALQIVHAPEAPPPSTLADWCVSAGNLPLRSGFSWEPKVLHPYFWALGTQPGQVTAARDLRVVTQAGLGFSSQTQDTR